jgi:hypothetical protein
MPPSAFQNTNGRQGIWLTPPGRLHARNTDKPSQEDRLIAMVREILLRRVEMRLIEMDVARDVSSRRYPP